MKILLKGFICSADFSTLKRGCLLIDNGRIAAVSDDIYGSSAADRQLVFKDEIIAPGFIDAHGHSDISAPAAPECFSKLSQGITAEVCGNCGLSPFPLTAGNQEHLQELYDNYGVELCWHDMAGYLEFNRQRSVRMKLFPLCGHNTLRSAVAGYEKEKLSSAELRQMNTLLSGMLDSGAPGLSAGLLYTPGCFADENELLGLMQTLARHNKLYATHLRSEGDHLTEALEESLTLACRAGLKKFLVSHLKTAGSANFNKLDRVFELIAAFKKEGMDIRFDRYPYIESQTMLSITLGREYGGFTDSAITTLLADPQEREKALVHLKNLRDENYWKKIRLAGCTHPAYRQYSGMRFSDFAADPSRAVIDILQYDAPGAMMAAAVMSEENMLRIISHPDCMFGSDGNALPPDERFGRPHPRSFGGAARFARLLLDTGISIPELCYKLSGAAAEFFSLPQTGHLQTDFRADITVFSPEEIDSAADFASPCTPASGIKAVIADGILHHF